MAFTKELWQQLFGGEKMKQKGDIEDYHGTDTCQQHLGLQFITYRLLTSLQLLTHHSRKQTHIHQSLEGYKQSQSPTKLKGNLGIL